MNWMSLESFGTRSSFGRLSFDFRGCKEGTSRDLFPWCLTFNYITADPCHLLQASLDTPASAFCGYVIVVLSDLICNQIIIYIIRDITTHIIL